MWRHALPNMAAETIAAIWKRACKRVRRDGRLHAILDCDEFDGGHDGIDAGQAL